MGEKTSLESGRPRKTSLLRDSAIMASGTMVSRILGFVRNAMLLAVIGTAAGGVNAAFQTANTLPNIVFNILASGVFDAVLVPQIVSALKRKSGDVYVNRLLTLAGTVLFLVTILTMVAAPLLVVISAAGYDAEIRSLAIAFALLCLPQLFFYGVYNLLGELLNARGVFGPYMWAPVVNNVVGIAGLAAFMVLWGTSPSRFDIADLTSAQFWLLGGSATLGVVCQALVLLWPMKKAGITFKPDFRFRGTSFGRASKVAAWTFATLGVSQLGILSTNNIAALADTWARTHDVAIVGISAYATAFMIFMLPQSLIAVSLATAVFTRMANAVVDNDEAEVARHYHTGVKATTSLTAIAAAMLLASSVPIMQAVTLTTTDTSVVRSYAWVLVALLPGVASIGMALMSQRVFFAYEDAKPVFLIGIIPTFVQLIVGWTLYAITDAQWWVVGAAAAETVCRIIQGFIALAWVAHRNSHVKPWQLVRSFGVAVASASIAATVGWIALVVIGVDTVADTSLMRFTIALLKVAVVSVIVLVTHLVALRFIDPSESARTIAPMLARLRVPEKIRSVLAAPLVEDAQSTQPGPIMEDGIEGQTAESVAEESAAAESIAAESVPADQETPGVPSDTSASDSEGQESVSSDDADDTDDTTDSARTADQASATLLADETNNEGDNSVGDNSVEEEFGQPTAPLPVRRSIAELTAPTKPTAKASHNMTSTGFRFDPTRPTLIFAGVLVAISTLWAIHTMFKPIETPEVLREAMDDQQSAQSAQSEQPAAEVTPAIVAPVVSSATIFSWDGTGDHEDEAIYLIDGDPETQWHSRWYDINNFAEDNTVTILLKLDQVSTVSGLRMQMDATTSGGELVIRAVNPDSPREGQELAVTAMSPTMEVTFNEAVQTDAISLSFRTMPTSVEGKSWAWVNEVSLW